MRVELRAEARVDLLDGARFYARQAPGLDAHFIECLRVDLQTLESTAGIHERFRGFYRKLSKRFPYAIYYMMMDDVVDVVAILDCRSNPTSTDTRLGRAKR